MRVGSPWWRLRNYGLVATSKYLLNYNRQLKTVEVSNSPSAVSFPEFAKALGMSVKEYELCKLIVGNVIAEYESQATLFKDNHSLKSAVPVGLLPLRLLVISLVIIKSRPTVFLESGTQHGISAATARKVLDTMDNGFHKRVTTVDVTESFIPLRLERIDYEILPSPVRKNWKSLSIGLRNLNDNLIFFHDSDHSHENMTFELNWALNQLNAKFIISDDISGNSAFINLARASKREFYIILGAQEPPVGVIINV